jgi:6-phosphogluconolactonase
MTPRRVHIFRSADELSSEAAADIIRLLQAPLSSRGVASIALSGGSTPRNVYEKLGATNYAAQIDWKKVHLFWGDERCVPPDTAESNYRMVKETLLSRIVFPEANVHRIMAELPPERAALHYERLLLEWFGIRAGQLPTFDVFLLGLGEDGHTASLFPGAVPPGTSGPLVTSLNVKHLEQYRVTMSLPVINNAAAIVFLVSGKEKAAIVQEVLEGTVVRSPAQLVKPKQGQLLWYIDMDAASKLKKVDRT